MYSPTKLAAIVTCSVLTVGTVALAEAPSWPVFHGPNGDNISTETGLLKTWPEDGPPLAWTAEGIGDGFASASLAGGVIYTAGNVEDHTVVTAMDLDGKIKWQAECGKAWTRGPAGTRATPTIDGDRLYYENPYGDVVCLDVAGGKKIWEINILDEFDGKNIIWALSESLVIDGDNVICCPFGKKASVVALNKKTGRVAWTAEGTGDKAGYATVSIVKFAGRRMILAMSGKALVGVDADKGKLLFRYEHKTKHDVNATQPIFNDGMVFITSGYGAGSEMVKLTASGGKITAQQAWENKDMDNHHGGVILLDGYLYGSAMKRNWICLDWKTGQTKYSDGGVGKGAVTCADGMLYTQAENQKNRTVGLVRPTPEGHQLVSQFAFPEGGKGRVWAHPVVCGGRLYIRHGDKLFAFNVKAG
jgi:outer membrane protein assembly factor BamB